MTALFPADKPPTILAGAGLSAPAPTSLPGWWALNDAVLEALGEAVERVTGRSGLSGNFRTAVMQRRDTTPFLKPDLQAQLIEDEIGDVYFRALACVDSTMINPAHELIAELALQGRIGAIVTTNFDCTIERALDLVGVPYQCYASPDEFEHLSRNSPSLALVKVHGSSTHPATMVDTLRQRLHGRPEALSRWMQDRFVRFSTVGIGFSGEDLQYERNYLSIRPALMQGAQFRFLIQRNTAPSVPLDKLFTEFPGRVDFSYGELPVWLFEVSRREAIEHRVPAPITYSQEDVAASRSAARAHLATGLNNWASSLSRMEVLNAVTALLASAGQRPVADHLLERTWKYFREPPDCHGPAYARYLYNYGETLLRRATLRNPYDSATDFHAWKEAADQDPGQFFHRALQNGGSEAAEGRYLLCRFFSGVSLSSIGAAMNALHLRITPSGGIEDSLSLALIDAAFSLSELLELCGLGRVCVTILESSYRSAARLGDEYRRAEAAWRLARNLAFGLGTAQTHSERVAQLALECTDIAGRLNIRECDAGGALSRAIAAMARRDWATGALEAKRAENIYAEIPDLLRTAFARRERIRALVGVALSGGRIQVSDWDELSLQLQNFATENAPGLRPLIKLELAILASYFDEKLSTELATDAAEEAELQQHPYVGPRARELLKSLKA